MWIKLKFLKKTSGCGLYTGALNRPKITVKTILTTSQPWQQQNVSRSGIWTHWWRGGLWMLTKLPLHWKVEDKPESDVAMHYGSSVTIIIIIIIIIALKGTIRGFYNLLTTPRTVSNTHTQVARAKSCANHVQHIQRLSHATCSGALGSKGQFSY